MGGGGGGRRTGTQCFFKGGGGGGRLNSEIFYPIRLHMISSRRGAWVCQIFNYLSSSPHHTFEWNGRKIKKNPILSMILHSEEASITVTCNSGKGRRDLTFTHPQAAGAHNIFMGAQVL